MPPTLDADKGTGQELAAGAAGVGDCLYGATIGWARLTEDAPGVVLVRRVPRHRLENAGHGHASESW